VSVIDQADGHSGTEAQPSVVVVLGATGFVGRHVCAAFHAAGWEVVGVARTEPVTPVPYRHETLDLVDAEPARLSRLLADTGARTVVNGAGAVWAVTAEQMQSANTDLVVRLVVAASGLARPPRLIQLGSVHEYGPVPRGVDIREDTRPAPVAAYGRTKLAGGQAVLTAAAAGDLDGVVLRIANISGPGAPGTSLLGKVAHHLATSADRLATGDAPEPLRLTPLLAHRDFVDVRDVAEAVLAAAEAGSEVSGRVVNIGRGEAVGMRPLVDRMIELSGLDVVLDEQPTTGPQRGDSEWQQLDIGLARELLGWGPRRSLDESLLDLLAHDRTTRCPGPFESNREA